MRRGHRPRLVKSGLIHCKTVTRIALGHVLFRMTIKQEETTVSDYSLRSNV